MSNGILEVITFSTLLWKDLSVSLLATKFWLVKEQTDMPWITGLNI